MLLEHFGHDCVLLEQNRRPDGEGGSVTAWEESTAFRAAIAMKASAELKEADKQTQNKTFTVLTAREVFLPYHAVFRSNDTGAVYRIIADGEKATPLPAWLSLREATAEEWRLTE